MLLSNVSSCMNIFNKSTFKNTPIKCLNKFCVKSVGVCLGFGLSALIGKGVGGVFVEVLHKFGAGYLGCVTKMLQRGWS